nr:hypothetical protein GCM10020185_86160 [Pseudomonas brassicacearum subsp. brassicacearum]
MIGTEGSADARAQLRQSRIDAAMQGSETLPYLKTQEKDMYKTVGLPISKQFSGMGVSKKKTRTQRSGESCAAEHDR